MDFFSRAFNELAKIPGSPEAVIEGIRGGFSGDYSWNPYGSGVGVGDVIGGGTKESQDPQKRQYGRAAGTIVGAAFAAPALASYSGGGAGAASYSGATAGEGAYGSLGGYGAVETGGYGTQSALGAGYTGDYAAAGYDPGYVGGFDSGAYLGDAAAWGYAPESFAGGGNSVAPTGNGFFDSLTDWAKRRYASMGAKDFYRLGMGAYGLYNTLAAQRAANRPIDVTSHPMYANMMESAMRQARAGGYQGSPMMAQAVAGKSAELYHQMYLEQQQRAANKMGATYGSLSTLGLLGSGLIGGP